MAEFPLFEGGSNVDTTVRTSRIGPEPPMPEGLKAASQAFSKIGSVMNEQHKAQQQLLVGSYHAGFDADIAKYQSDAEQNGYDKDWQTNYQKAVGDSQKKWGQYLSDHGADGSTIKHAQNVTTIASAGKLPEIGGQQMRLLHVQNKALTQSNVDLLVQHSLVGDPIASIKHLSDTIDYAAEHHMLNPEEALTMKNSAMSKMAVAHRDYDVESNPAQAIKTFGVGNAKALQDSPVYAWLTPEQRFEAVRRAVELQKQNQAKGSEFLKATKQQDLAALDKMSTTNQWDMEQLGEMFRRGSITQGQYYTATQGAGHPTEGGPGDPGRAAQFRRSLDSMVSEREVHQAESQEAGVQTYNKFDHAANTQAVSATLNRLHTESQNFKNYVKENGDNIPKAALTDAVGYPNKQQFDRDWGKVQPALDGARRDYETELTIIGTEPENRGAVIQAQGKYSDRVRQIIKNKIDDGTLNPSVNLPNRMPPPAIFDLNMPHGAGVPGQPAGEQPKEGEPKSSSEPPAVLMGTPASENPADELNSAPRPMSRRELRQRLGVAGTAPSLPPAGSAEGSKGGEK